MRDDNYTLLSCGCVVNYTSKPLTRELVTCRHHGVATVLIVALGEWSAVCNWCTWHPSYGPGGRLTAEIGAAKHRQRKNRDHVVTVYTPEGKVHHVYDGGGQQELTF